MRVGCRPETRYLTSVVTEYAYPCMSRKKLKTSGFGEATGLNPMRGPVVQSLE